MNKQLVFSVIAVVFATALIASLVVDQASAQRHNRQSISQHNHQSQSSTVVTAGANSGVSFSGNNAATATNTNNGGNAAAF
jgi:hypothetical protein